MHLASSTSTQLQPAPPTFTQLISASTQLQLPSPSSFQPPPSSLDQPQRYKNQNIARNWAISPNLDQKNRSCQFCLKISTHGIFEVVISKQGLYLWNSDPKIYFWQIWAGKVKVVHFAWKFAPMVYRGCWILVWH